MLRKIHLVDFLFLCLCGLFAEQLLFNSPVISRSIADSMKLCVETIIPSLFCFMVLTSFLSNSSLGKWLSLPMLPLCRLLCLPVNCGAALILCFLGGYPAGVKALSDAWQRGEIDDKTLQRMLLFAICPAPSFVIVTVGCYFLCNQMLGCLLYGAQVLSVLFFALLSSVPASVQSKQKLSRTLFQGESLPYDHALVEAVLFSSRTLLGMCGYIVFFAVLSSLLAQFPLPTEVLTLSSAALEISGACGKLAALSIPHRLSVLSFFLSFGGLSVQFQLKSILGNCPCSFLRIFFGRIAHGLCSAFFTELLFSAFPQTAAVFSADASPLPLSNASTPILSLCLIGMICILLNGSQRKVAAKE